MTQCSWHDFYLVQNELRLWTDDDVEAAEEVLGLRLPEGYRELVTTLGDGVISDVIRVLSPAELPKEQAFFRRVHEGLWVFDEPDETMTQDYALECTMIADSDGDHVVVHPGSGQMHVLPRDAGRTYMVGADLPDVVAWWLDSGVAWHPRPFRFFESFVGPIEAANGAAAKTQGNAIAEAIRAVGVHDVEVTNEDERGRVEQRVFFFKSIGGWLSVDDYWDTPAVNLHVRYQTTRGPELRAQLLAAASSGGASFGRPWSMTP